jgi:vacuolar-type H+-ATPase subunit F/Vma7
MTADQAPVTAGTVAVIGEHAQVRGYALAGATVLVADGADAVRRAWASLDEHTGLVVLTPAAAAQLGAELDAPWPLTAVIVA